MFGSVYPTPLDKDNEVWWDTNLSSEMSKLGSTLCQHMRDQGVNTDEKVTARSSIRVAACDKTV